MHAAAAYPQYPYQPQRSGPSAFGMMTLGFLGGGTAGYFSGRQAIGKDGKISDTFAKQVYEKISKIDANDKELYKQLNNILKKIDGVKDIEGLKKLFEKNKNAAETLCQGMNTTMEKLFNTLSKENLKATKETLKKGMKVSNDMMYQQAKNIIGKCWDKDKKEFFKADNIDSKIVNILKNTKTKGQWKKALKYGGITAGVMGALTIGYKMLTSRN